MEEIRNDLLLPEFTQGLKERADRHFKGHLHQAFIAWYIEAEFGQVKWEFTDGPRDGGIDAVIWRKPGDKPPVILQSKFSERIGERTLPKSDYNDFQRVVSAFQRGGEAFDEFLENAAPEIRKVYVRALKLFDGNWLRDKKAFRLITTSKGPLDSSLA